MPRSADLKNINPQSRLPLVIVNPASASGATGERWPGVASALRTHFGAFSCAFTGRSGDGQLIAAREARAGRRFIIACGGDGTISEVANGILESGEDVELGVLPSGTGGDFRRTLRIPARAGDAALSLRRAVTRTMDVGRVTYINHEGSEETRHFLNVASFGMGGAVVERVKEKSAPWLPANTSKLLGGSAAFAVAALHTALTFTKPIVALRLDDKPEFRLQVTNLCVANAQYFGGGMHIAPQAKVNDGYFDVVAVGNLSALLLLANSYRLYLGTHLGMQQVHHACGTRLTARPERGGTPAVRLEVDGELVGQLPATFDVVPTALRVRAPA
ncbi:MAG TPA: diacylglycerol kinase family protein [Pyrinomonadaceae bacterium]|nr:diacylglycerol kinase family protein [Pyrinomonadaceae bacterium]